MWMAHAGAVSGGTTLPQPLLVNPAHQPTTLNRRTRLRLPPSRPHRGLHKLIGTLKGSAERADHNGDESMLTRDADRGTTTATPPSTTSALAGALTNTLVEPHQNKEPDDAHEGA
jgi:hypothetical protein